LLYIAPGQKPDPVLADIARYLTSREGQQIVLKKGIFLPLREKQITGLRQVLGAHGVDAIQFPSCKPPDP